MDQCALIGVIQIFVFSHLQLADHFGMFTKLGGDVLVVTQGPVYGLNTSAFTLFILLKPIYSWPDVFFTRCTLQITLVFFSSKDDCTFVYFRSIGPFLTKKKLFNSNGTQTGVRTATDMISIHLLVCVFLCPFVFSCF